MGKVALTPHWRKGCRDVVCVTWRRQGQPQSRPGQPGGEGPGDDRSLGGKAEALDLTLAGRGEHGRQAAHDK
jgi:hypothetical protein